LSWLSNPSIELPLLSLPTELSKVLSMFPVPLDVPLPSSDPNRLPRSVPAISVPFVVWACVPAVRSDPS
jgi:hypothetical protein